MREKLALLFLFFLKFPSLLLGLEVDKASFILLKPFGFPSTQRAVSPATLIEITQDKQEEGDLVFSRTSRGSVILSFPQEEEWIIISSKNFFRKEIYKKKSQVSISQDFSYYLGDIISLYLYDSSRREWLTPLLMESLEGTSSLSLLELIVQQNGKRQALNARYPISIEKGDVELLLDFSSHLSGKIAGMTGLYSLVVGINEEEWLSFFAQAIRESDNNFVWEGLDPQKGSYEKGQFILNNLPLRAGMNEIRIEVKNFLYRSLVFKGFIKVL